MPKFIKFESNDEEETRAFNESLMLNQRPWMIIGGKIYLQKPEIIDSDKDLVEIDEKLEFQEGETLTTVSEIRLKRYESDSKFVIGIIGGEIETEPIYFDDLKKSLESDGVYDLFYPVDCDMGCCGTAVKTRLIDNKYITWDIAYFRERFPKYFIEVKFQDKNALLHLPLYFSVEQLKEELTKF